MVGCSRDKARLKCSSLYLSKLKSIPNRFSGTGTRSGTWVQQQT